MMPVLMLSSVVYSREFTFFKDWLMAYKRFVAFSRAYCLEMASAAMTANPNVC